LRPPRQPRVSLAPGRPMPARALAVLRLTVLLITAQRVRACGFVIASFPVSDAELMVASERLIPRGPDASNRHSAGNWTLAHYLLHMHGERTLQPYVAKDTRRFAMFNGEVYNYREIQRLSRTPAQIFTADGQALLPAYELALQAHPNNISAMAAHFVSSLDGEFAAVVLDLDKGLLLLGSDPFAIKPLYYGCGGGRFAAASYASVLERLGFRGEKKDERVRPRSCSHDEPTVFAMKPNTALVVDISSMQVVAEVQAVQWRLAQFASDTLQWQHAFKKALAKRVHHTTPDVELSLTLSFGMDSGLIHCMMDALKAPHTTYSIVGADPPERVAARIGWSNFTQTAHTIYVTPARLLTELHFVNSEIDPYPFQAALVDVAGASRLGTNAAAGLSFIYRHAQQHKRRLFLVGAGPDDHMTMYRAPSRYPVTEAYPEFGPLRTAPFPSTPTLDGFFPWPTFQANSLLSGLRREEFISGAFGIESRYPFLDKAVVQAWLDLAPSVKNGRYKAPLVDLMERQCKGYPFNNATKVAYIVLPTKRGRPMRPDTIPAGTPSIINEWRRGPGPVNLTDLHERLEYRVGSFGWM